MIGSRFKPSLLKMVLMAGLVFGSVNAARADGGPKGPDDAPISSAKLNAYVEGYNRLLSTFGLPAEYQSYSAQQIAKRGANIPTIVTDGWIGLAEDDLKKARALPEGGLPELDAVADTMIPRLDQLVSRLKALKTYYESRGNLEDNMARGHAEDPLVLQEFKQSLADMDALSTALDAAIDRRDQAHLAVLKSSGDTVRYDGELALLRSKTLVNLFATSRDYKDPAKIQRGDALVSEIAAALEEETKLIDAYKAAHSDDTTHYSNLTYAAGHLQEMIGAYREAKHATYALYGNPLVAAYNQAIDSLNLP